MQFNTKPRKRAHFIQPCLSISISLSPPCVSQAPPAPLCRTTGWSGWQMTAWGAVWRHATPPPAPPPSPTPRSPRSSRTAPRSRRKVRSTRFHNHIHNLVHWIFFRSWKSLCPRILGYMTKHSSCLCGLCSVWLIEFHNGLSKVKQQQCFLRSVKDVTAG